MRGEHKYRILVKVGNLDSGPADMKKYRTSNLLKFTEFLDKTWPTWKWFNVYDKKTDRQLGNFTNKDRPNNKYVEF
ncbi:MAG: hypothetical protein RLQ12_23550 [Cyclobacteriaceae bacterium]